MSTTAEEFISKLKKRLAYYNPNLDLTSGNVATDLGVEGFAEELAAISSEEDRIRLLYLFDANSFTEKEADALANSFGIYRLEATKATGEVTFCATTAPAAGSQFTIPIGTAVTTTDDTGNIKTFYTTTEGVIDATTPINTSTNYYEVIVNVQASVAGSASNVGPGAINTITTKVSGISIVYNANSITNGTDKETKDALIGRVKNNITGYIYGTKASLLNKVLSYNVKDAFIVDPNNEFSTRGPGSVDIYVLDDGTANSYTQTTTSKQQELYLLKTPVRDEHATAEVIFDDQTSLPEGAGFYIDKDETSIYAGSSKAKDKLVWTDSGYQEMITHNSYSVTYPYNNRIGDLQEKFDAEETHILTSDVLIRTTTELPVRMDFDIVTLAGYDGNTVRTNVIYAIQSFVNNFTLNQTLRQSDIIGLVENTEGVDYVKLPMNAFCLASETTNKVEDVPSSPLEYIRISRENIVIG